MNAYLKVVILAAVCSMVSAKPNDIVGELTLKCKSQMSYEKCSGESGCKWDCASSSCGLLAVWMPSASDVCVDHCNDEAGCGGSGVCYYDAGACKQIAKKREIPSLGHVVSVKNVEVGKH